RIRYPIRRTLRRYSTLCMLCNSFPHFQPRQVLTRLSSLTPTPPPNPPPSHHKTTPHSLALGDLPAAPALVVAWVEDPIREDLVDALELSIRFGDRNARVVNDCIRLLVHV